MAEKKKRKIGIIIESILTILAVGLAVYFAIQEDRSIIVVIVCSILFMLHMVMLQIILYHLHRIKTNKRKKLYVHNYLLLVTNFLFLLVFLFLQVFVGEGMEESITLTSHIISVFLASIGIMFVLHHTGTVLYSIKSKKVQQCIKDIAPNYGFYLVYICVSIIWLPFLYGYKVEFFVFAYSFLLLVQLSLVYTNLHNNSFWGITFEIALILHIVSYGIFIGNYVILLGGTILAIYVVYSRSKKVKKVQRIGILTLTGVGILVLGYFEKEQLQLAKVISDEFYVMIAVSAIVTFYIILSHNISRLSDRA